MAKPNDKKEKTERRHSRVRAKVSGTQERPRLSVFRSNKYIYAQLIDDESGRTLASASSEGKSGKSKLEAARDVGKRIAESAKKAKITNVVFDRGGHLYTGKTKELADSARKSGLIF